MNFEQYKKINAINASFLKACSFGHYQGFKYLHDKPYESDAMNFGSAVHAALLEPDVFQNEYAICPKLDKRKKGAKEIIADFELKNEGKKIIDSEDFEKINLIRDRCLKIGAINSALSEFSKEKTYLWTDSEYGDMKARLDLVNDDAGVVIDVKTTRNADEREFTSQLLALRYDIQMLHYSVALGKKTTVYSIAIESESAEVALYDLNNIVFSDFTRNRYNAALKVAKEVLKMTACPPKYKQEIIDLKLPEWAKKEVL